MNEILQLITGAICGVACGYIIYWFFTGGHNHDTRR